MHRQVLLAVSLWAVACEGFPLTRDVRVQQLDSVASALDRDPDADVLEFTAIPRPDLKGSKTRATPRIRNQSGPTYTAVMIPLVDPGLDPGSADRGLGSPRHKNGRRG